MASKKIFKCKKCAGQIEIHAEDKAPQCCGNSMIEVPMDQCILSSTAEHSRFDNLDDPCDDGRAGS